MSSIYVREFEESLGNHDTGHTRTATEEFDAALADIVREPVGGAPLPFEEVSLDGWRINV